MRIGLLAPEENGKTSYLVALYAVLVHDKSDSLDYPFRFQVKDPRKRAELNELFARLVDESLPKEDRFPRKTKDRIEEYAITVTHKSSPGMAQDLTIVDYPGELLRGALPSMSSEKQTSHDELRQSLLKCDAFIVVLDSIQLVRGSTYGAKHKLSPNDINTLLLETLSAARGPFSHLGTPVVFCPSKLDMLGGLEEEQGRNIQAAFRRIRTLFPTLFVETHRHPVIISGISLGSTIGGQPEEGVDTTKRVGPFEPFFVETPLEFCLLLGLYSASAHYMRDEERWMAEFKSDSARLAQAERAGISDWLDEWGKIPDFFDTPSAYHARQKNASETLRRKSFSISTALHAAACDIENILHTQQPFSHCVVYLSGRECRVGEKTPRGEVPILFVENHSQTP